MGGRRRANLKLKLGLQPPPLLAAQVVGKGLTSYIYGRGRHGGGVVTQNRDKRRRVIVLLLGRRRPDLRNTPR